MKANSNQLHAATDRLNAALLDAESALAELNLGVTAEVPIPAIDDDLRVRTLCFGKVSNAFQLSVIVDGETHGVTSVSRSLRLRLVPLLPQLRDALLGEYDAQIQRVEAGTSDVQAFTASLRESITEARSRPRARRR